MIHLYAQQEPYGLLIRTGHAMATLSKALNRAKKIRAFQCEVRDESLPRSRSLLAVFVEGVQVGH